jgi:hypothetical protein
LGSASNSAARDTGHTGALYSKNGDQAAEVGIPLFTTTSGLYGDVLWSGELEGFIYMGSLVRAFVHEMIPTLICLWPLKTFKDQAASGQAPRTKKAAASEAQKRQAAR